MSATKTAPKKRSALARETVRIEIGNPLPRLPDGTRADLGAPSVTTINMPPSYCNTVKRGADIEEVRDHIAGSLYRPDRTTQGLTTLADLGHGSMEALLAVCHLGNGAWSRHCALQGADWVHAPDHPVLERYIADFLRCPIGKPENVEDTHYTIHGPPGVGPGFLYNKIPDLQMVASSAAGGSRDQISDSGFGANASSWYGAVGSASTAPTATTITAAGTPFVASALIGQSCVYPAIGAYGVVTANTTSVVTVDRWSLLTNPGGAAYSGSFSTSAAFAIVPKPPLLFVGLTANSTFPTPTTTQTSLPGEITTASGGLIRKIGSTAHTAGTATLTITIAWTTTSSDVVPVTIQQSGLYPVLVYAGFLGYQSQLSAPASLSVANQTLTETIAMGLT